MLGWLLGKARSVNTSGFKISLLVFTTLYLSGFALSRMIMGTHDSLWIYLSLYIYCIISAVMAMIYNIFPDYCDKAIISHRNQQGNMECHCFLYYLIIQFWLGPFSIVSYQFTNPHNAWHRTLFCRLLMYSPSLTCYGLVIVLPIIYDDSDKVEFIVPFVIAWLLWIYIFVESILVVFRRNKYIANFHPFTWLIIPLCPLFICWKEERRSNLDDDIKYLTNAGILNVKLQGYAKEDANEDLEIGDTPDFRNSTHENFYEMFNRVARTEVFGPKRKLTSHVGAKEDPEEMYHRQAHGYSMKMPNVFVHRKTNDFRTTLEKLDQTND